MDYINGEPAEPVKLTKKEQRLRNKIQEKIHYCYNCQAYDSGDIVWVMGEKR